MTNDENQVRVNDTDSRFVVELQVGVGGIQGGETCVLVSLGSLALGTEYNQALFNAGPANETHHFVMSQERARDMADRLLEAANR